MRLRVKCVSGEVIIHMNVSCGNGDRTFKWLGLAVAARFTNQAPHGFRRHRESPGVTSCNTQLMPLDIYIEDDQHTFLHPNHKVSDHVEDEQEVTVRLGQRLVTTNRGHPDLTRWAIIAFAVSSHQANKRAIAIREQQTVMDTRRRTAEKAERDLKARQYALKAVGMREIMAEKLNDEHEIAIAVAENWKDMIASANFERVCRSTTDQIGCREVIKRHYKALSEIFKNYSAATSTAGQSHELDVLEYAMFVTELELFPLTKALRDAGNIIFETSCDDYKTPMSMNNAEFFNSLLRLAGLRYQDGGSGAPMWGGVKMPRLMPQSNGAADEDPSVPQFDDVDPAMSLADALERLCTNYMRPLMERKLKSAVARYAIETDEVLAMFHDYLPRLKEQFCRYSSDIEAHVDHIHEVSITIMEFGVMVEDSGMMGGTGNSDTELTLKEVRQAFSAAQDASGDGSGSLGRGGQTASAAQAQGALSHSQLLSFPEFIEAIARVGCLKWEDRSVPVTQKIQNATYAICEAEPRHAHRRK